MTPPENDLMASDHDLLTRIDERTKLMASQFETFVTHAEFKPVKIVVYGLVAVTLTTVAGGILTLIIKASQQ